MARRALRHDAAPPETLFERLRRQEEEAAGGRIFERSPRPATPRSKGTPCAGVDRPPRRGDA